jgi:phosphatidylserine/phosphatidylglycerophosphate/cardiolipin synthase-like enzyme
MTLVTRGFAFDLVTTGPEASGVTNRDTAVVVHELFAAATASVLVAGYAVYQGRRIFRTLAERMLQGPAMRVRLFVDVQRPPGDTSEPREIARRYADRFVNQQWPANHPYPAVYYLPASLDQTERKRTSMHAKCVVVDGTASFISSANFTEAAQERNVEIGILIRSNLIATRIVRHFDALVNDGFMEPLPIH